MSLNNFIPEIWSAKVLEALPAVLVFASLCNGDYDGDISKMGDVVRISGIGDITVSSYVKDTTIGSPQALADAQTALVISQAKFFNFAIDDVDKAQGNPAVMGAAMRWAAYSLAKQADLFVAGLYTDIPAANSIGSFASPDTTLVRGTNTNIGAGHTLYDYFIQLSQLLTQNNVPNDGGRFVVMPAWGKTLLTQDYRFTSFNTPSADATIATGAISGGGAPPAGGYVGRVENMAIYESNNCVHIGGTAVGTSGSQDVFIAGHSMGWSFAANVKETEGYRPPDKFGDAVKGLYLYGAKVVRPYALAAAYLQMPA